MPVLRSGKAAVESVTGREAAGRQDEVREPGRAMRKGEEMSEKLGPCPLCGGEAWRSVVYKTKYAGCKICGITLMPVETWNKLSTLADRLREHVVAVCDKALKGGEG